MSRLTGVRPCPLVRWWCPVRLDHGVGCPLEDDGARLEGRLPIRRAAPEAPAGCWPHPGATCRTVWGRQADATGSRARRHTAPPRDRPPADWRTAAIGRGPGTVRG